MMEGKIWTIWRIFLNREHFNLRNWQISAWLNSPLFSWLNTNNLPPYLIGSISNLLTFGDMGVSRNSSWTEQIPYFRGFVKVLYGCCFLKSGVSK